MRLYQAFREGGQQSDLQVGQVEMDLLNSRGQLLGSGGGGRAAAAAASADISTQLDNFKLQLGLPLTVALDLDNTPLQADPRSNSAASRTCTRTCGNWRTEARKFNPDDPVGAVPRAAGGGC